MSKRRYRSAQFYIEKHATSQDKNKIHKCINDAISGYHQAKSHYDPRIASQVMTAVHHQILHRVDALTLAGDLKSRLKSILWASYRSYHKPVVQKICVQKKQEKEEARLRGIKQRLESGAKTVLEPAIQDLRDSASIDNNHLPDVNTTGPIPARLGRGASFLGVGGTLIAPQHLANQLKNQEKKK